MKLTFFSKLINGKKPVIEPVIVPKYDESKLDFILKNIGKFRKLKFDKNENNVFENKETSFIIECEYSVELNGEPEITLKYNINGTEISIGIQYKYHRLLNSKIIDALGIKISDVNVYSGSFVKNNILTEDEFGLFVNKIYDVFLTEYNKYKYIFESEHDYTYFQDSEVQKRIETKKAISDFIK